MSDNIPCEIQMEIIKWLPVKPLIQFRSVSKPWKSFIDSSDFIKGYGARHTQPRSLILKHRAHLVDDDNCEIFKVVGACHGLLCLSCYNKDNIKRMVVIWNPSIRKSFGIALPIFDTRTHTATNFGFGVCPVTRDPTVVKFVCTINKPWHVEVFTLSSGVWNVIPSGNFPRQTIRLNPISTQVVIDRFIYWGAREKTFSDDGEYTTKPDRWVIVSFDLITKEFKVVDLPDSLTKELLMYSFVSVSKLRGSLVVFGYIMAEGSVRCSVWVMEHDSSFTKLFSFGTHASKILGFTKNGETIFETQKNGWNTTLNFYDPCSQQIKNLGISGVANSFFMGSYKESLLLFNHLDSRIYDE